MTSKRERLSLLAQRLHERSHRKTCVIADSAGMAVSYYNDFRNGRRPNIGLPLLRRLCEHGWGLTMEESLPIFAVRIALDSRLTPRLPLAFYWRIGS